MSRARLALWAGGAALLAAWLSSAAGTMPGRPLAADPAPPQASPPLVEGVDPAADAVRTPARREPAAPLRPVVRNPFTLAPRRPAAPADGSEPVVPAGWAPSPAPPAPDASPRVSLAGIAVDETPSGPRRTAVLSVDGRVVLARVGDELLGLYQVRRIDDDAVELLDPGRGTPFRLRLP